MLSDKSRLDSLEHNLQDKENKVENKLYKVGLHNQHIEEGKQLWSWRRLFQELDYQDKHIKC